MGLIQPPVRPLPRGIDLTGQTGIVTGATSGLGLAIARQLLLLKISKLVLAVRNPAKGENVRESLLSDSAVQSQNPTATIHVMKLDTETNESVTEFTTQFRQQHNELHVLMLNAGGVSQHREMTSSGHEKAIHVNYLSNVVLQTQLLPLMEATAVKSGRPTRITWTGSRSYRTTSLLQKPLSQGATSLMNRFDNDESVALFGRYADSKLLGFLFLRELANHYKPDRVIINSFCPNTVKSGMASAMPFYIRVPASIIMSIKGRTPEQGAFLALNAALVAGPDTHGALLEDTDNVEPSEWVKSKEGRRAQHLLWNETVAEMDKLTDLPSWMKSLN